MRLDEFLFDLFPHRLLPLNNFVVYCEFIKFSWKIWQQIFYEKKQHFWGDLCLHFFYSNNFTQNLIDYFNAWWSVGWHMIFFYDRHAGIYRESVKLNINEIFSFLVVIFIRDVAQCNENKHGNRGSHEYWKVVNFLINVVVTSSYSRQN